MPSALGNARGSIGVTDLDRDGWEHHVALLNNAVGLVLKNVPGSNRTLRLTPLTSLSKRHELPRTRPHGHRRRRLRRRRLARPRHHRRLHRHPLPQQPRRPQPTRSVSVFRNFAASANHWSKIKLEGTLIAGSSFGVTEDSRLPFGLGSNTTVDRIQVIWPRRGSLADRTQIFTGPFDANRIISLSPERVCRLDFDQVGLLSKADLAAFLAAFLHESTPTGLTATSSAPCLDAPAPYSTLGYAADFNRDCTFNQKDLSAFTTDYLLETASPTNCNVAPSK